MVMMMLMIVAKGLFDISLTDNWLSCCDGKTDDDYWWRWWSWWLFRASDNACDNGPDGQWEMSGCRIRRWHLRTRAVEMFCQPFSSHAWKQHKSTLSVCIRLLFKASRNVGFRFACLLVRTFRGSQLALTPSLGSHIVVSTSRLRTTNNTI